MSAEKNWQTTRPTIRERTKFMLNNYHLSDVKFVALQRGGEKESEKAIPAHKFILAISSPVFEAMFFGELAETSDTIELPDCEYGSLLELFGYMYSDEVNLSESNVMGVLYLAKKYMVSALVDKCTKYLQLNLDPSNVFSVLPTAQRYEEKELVDRCWEVIDSGAGFAVKSDGFETIDRSLLEAVVARDTLAIEEVELFKAVDTWATKQCQKQGFGVSGKMKRKVLGEQIVTTIRFPLMKHNEFSAVVLDTNILTSDEIVNFFKFYSSTLTSPLGFSETPRINQAAFPRCGRFQSVSEEFVTYSSDRHYLLFDVDKDIMLHGLRVLGGKNNKYTVNLAVKDCSKFPSPVLVSKGGIFTTKGFQYKNFPIHGFDVLFDRPVHLKEKTRYKLDASISGQPSLKGTGGLDTVRSSGVTFQFFSSVLGGSEETNKSVGQFLEFIFCEVRH